MKIQHSSVIFNWMAKERANQFTKEWINSNKFQWFTRTDKLRNPKIFQRLPIKTVKFSNSFIHTAWTDINNRLRIDNWHYFETMLTLSSCVCFYSFLTVFYYCICILIRLLATRFTKPCYSWSVAAVRHRTSDAGDWRSDERPRRRTQETLGERVSTFVQQRQSTVAFLQGWTTAGHQGKSLELTETATLFVICCEILNKTQINKHLRYVRPYVVARTSVHLKS